MIKHFCDKCQKECSQLGRDLRNEEGVFLGEIDLCEECDTDRFKKLEGKTSKERKEILREYKMIVRNLK